MRLSRTVLSSLFHIVAHIENYNICTLEELKRQSCLKLEVMTQSFQESHFGKIDSLCIQAGQDNSKIACMGTSTFRDQEVEEDLAID